MLAELSDGDADVRLQAAEAAAKLPLRTKDEALLKSMFRPLAKALADERADVCEAASEAIEAVAGHVGDETALRQLVEPLIAATRHKEKRVRVAAAAPLAWLGQKLRHEGALAAAIPPLRLIGGARVEYGLDDGDVAGAAAEIAREHLADPRGVAIRLLAQ